MDTKRYLSGTELLDLTHPSLTNLVKARGWDTLDQYDKIGAAYRFVKEEIAFGYSEADNIPASKVLEDGYGQCNTKAILLMALLRKIGVPCRVHGFGIDKRVQKGMVPAFLYALVPRTLLHMWVEVEHGGRWLDLEGCILDNKYLSRVQIAVGTGRQTVCGYGVAIGDVQNAPVQWQGASTYIQKDAIVEDYGIFDTPDELIRERGANFRNSPIRHLLFKHVVRKLMNAKVARIRAKEPRLD
jgi:hypothetical protein